MRASPTRSAESPASTYSLPTRTRTILFCSNSRFQTAEKKEQATLALLKEATDTSAALEEKIAALELEVEAAQKAKAIAEAAEQVRCSFLLFAHLFFYLLISLGVMSHEQKLRPSLEKTPMPSLRPRWAT